MYINILKKIFFSILVSLFVYSANTNDILDINSYIEKNGFEDPYHVAYVMQRCAGLNMAYAKYLPSSMPKEKKIIGNLASEFFVVAGTMMRSKGMTSDQDNIKQNKKALLFFTDYYYKKIEKNQLETGSIFEGDMMGDFKICQSFAKELMKKN